MRSTILSMLQRSDKHLSGEIISEKLGITRSAVWKHIKSLKNEGYEIDSVRNRGYKLISAPSLLDEDRLQSLVDTSLIGKEIKVLKTVDSTNEEIKRLARSGAENGLVVAAECQSAGKGRFSRQWSSGVEVAERHHHRQKEGLRHPDGNGCPERSGRSPHHRHRHQRQQPVFSGRAERKSHFSLS